MIKTTKNYKITENQILEMLELLNTKAICKRAGVDYMRIANFKRGRIKSLKQNEINSIAFVIDNAFFPVFKALIDL